MIDEWPKSWLMSVKLSVDQYNCCEIEILSRVSCDLEYLMNQNEGYANEC